ncbi:hypothetical protein HM1_0484 [Heliomicrobium modesticaldum Ice1]|uniref:Uncharacterized protein n=1 Tax=Heliobacterium modesticaldum (strain ATCC 51547 / Ice1) TaxID=498761 RepID=B0TFJ9_HELMI|nr:hypothetical protein HM1_0484 [Heliomicrobium modesticaldum Ice1]
MYWRSERFGRSGVVNAACEAEQRAIDMQKNPRVLARQRSNQAEQTRSP